MTISKSNRIILNFLFLFTLLIISNGCKVFHKSNRSNGELITTKPHGRLAPGEIDDMSGRTNDHEEEPEQGRRSKRH